ncbi:twin-arginine translocase TatA/TatE family subunit [Ferruginibacter paludis]|jgi:sec-independent protein translocase protein TatA|uniref:Sec-independent protein translocase subunit TatA/TatB n=1 Tax=Ferruginibacter TaxID=1004303 RepID=UPI0025B30D58|nr:MULTISPECIES: twin-arginine translocase TatA/TatE family subunit [Ferruginibacter]MDN3657676.1 twin-arginine translocase TatA/TatE family subunit [Ferruginibacter paludis]
MLLSSLNAVFLIGMPGGSEWIFILLAVVLLFGGKKIPELMKGIGKGVRDFNDAKASVKNEIEEGMKEKDKDSEIRELKQQLEQKRAQEAQAQNIAK